MKQKEIIINGKLSIDAEEMIHEYFKTQTVNGIEDFVMLEKDFLDKYKGNYCLNEWSTIKQYAIYTIDCFMCFKSYDVIIESREKFYTYAEADYRLCSKCFDTNNKLYHSGLGLHLVGDIVSQKYH